jgi:hypothetical protein
MQRNIVTLEHSQAFFVFIFCSKSCPSHASPSRCMWIPMVLFIFKTTTCIENYSNLRLLWLHGISLKVEGLFGTTNNCQLLMFGGIMYTATRHSFIGKTIHLLHIGWQWHVCVKCFLFILMHFC